MSVYVKTSPGKLTKFSCRKDFVMLKQKWLPPGIYHSNMKITIRLAVSSFLKRPCKKLIILLSNKHGFRS